MADRSQRSAIAMLLLAVLPSACLGTRAPVSVQQPGGDHFLLPDQAPPIDMPGRIVWWDGPYDAGGTAHSLVIRTLGHEELWSDQSPVNLWTAAQSGYVAYRRQAQGSPQQLIVRPLARQSAAHAVASAPAGQDLEAPMWQPSGESVSFALNTSSDPMNDQGAGPCAVYSAGASSQSAQLIWSGTTDDFPSANLCPDPVFLEAGSGTLVAFEHGFEDPVCDRLDLIDVRGRRAAARLDVEAERHGIAASPDAALVAIVDSALYYGSRLPFTESLVGSDQASWPGEAHIQLLDVVSGRLTAIAGWQTDAGFTQPVWSTGGQWLAVAQPMGRFVAPTSQPAEGAYPAVAQAPGGPRFAARGTTVWVLARDGSVVRKLDVGRANAWPVASSPDGAYLLVSVADPTGSTDLLAYRLSDGARTRIATLSVAEPYLAWLP